MAGNSWLFRFLYRGRYVGAYFGGFPGGRFAALVGRLQYGRRRRAGYLGRGTHRQAGPISACSGRGATFPPSPSTSVSVFPTRRTQRSSTVRRFLCSACPRLWQRLAPLGGSWRLQHLPPRRTGAPFRLSDINPTRCRKGPRSVSTYDPVPLPTRPQKRAHESLRVPFFLSFSFLHFSLSSGLSGHLYLATLHTRSRRSRTAVVAEMRKRIFSRRTCAAMIE